MTAAESGFASWAIGIDNAEDDPKWDVYDCEIILAINEINQHLIGQGGYSPLDWRIIKAMIWVETGAKSKYWKTNPMQIGMFNDPGLDVVLSGKEGSSLVVPPPWRTLLTLASVKVLPAHNIRAGTAYLLTKLANFAFREVQDSDTRIHEIRVTRGDSLEKIARSCGSTVETLNRLNPGTYTIYPGQILKYQKSSRKLVISGWKPFTSENVARYYNGRGDALYVRKLDYALSSIFQRAATLCDR